MTTEEFNDWDMLANRHAADWQRLARASEVATVFQTWEWNAAWWAHHKSGKRLWAMVFRADEKGPVVGIAALFQSALPSLLRTIRFVGTGGSDYLDILAAPGHEQTVALAFADCLAARRNRWDWADLQQVRPDAVAESLTAASLSGGVVRGAAWTGETCPFLHLPGDWETLRKSLPRKMRQNVGYYARSLERQYAVEYRLATSATLDADLDAFFFLHQKRWNRRWLPGAFASRQARAFHTDAARQLLEVGMLRLHTLLLDGEPQASLYCFQKGTRCCYYLGGFEPELARLSLGTVLTAHAIRWAIEQDKADTFDFLRGDEPYKYKWGAQDRFNQRVSLMRRGVLRPRLLAGTGHASLRMEQRLKHWMHQKHGGAKKSSDG